MDATRRNRPDLGHRSRQHGAVFGLGSNRERTEQEQARSNKTISEHNNVTNLL
jgi:hypothetical protein